MIKTKITTFLLAMTAVFSNAIAEKTEKIKELKTLEMLKITADSSAIDYEKGVLTFVGDVKVKDPEIEIEADKIKLLFTKKQEIKTFTATGNNKSVIITLHRTGDEDVIAKGDVAVYDAEKGNVTLTGENTTLVHGVNNIIGAKLITFFMNEKGLSSFNSSGGRTTVTFGRKSELLKKKKNKQ